MTHPLRSKPAPPRPAGDLFHGSLTDWSNSPTEAFEVWMDSHKLATSSRTVYRSLWGGFVSYLRSHQVEFAQVDSDLIRLYLEGSEMRLEQRERIHRLIERAFNDIARTRVGAQNPAANAAVQRRNGWRLAERNDDTDFLSDSDHGAVVDWIESVQAPQVRRAKARPELSSKRAPAAWRFSRNRAACAVLLGSGVKPVELSHLSVNDVQCTLPGTEGQAMAPNAIEIHVQATTAEERRIRVPPWAGGALVHWLTELKSTAPAAANAGDTFPLFPRAAGGGVLSIRSIERLVETFFEGFQRSAGGDGSPITPQLLRNSFAAHLFSRGLGRDDVQTLMGYRQDLSATRLHAAWRVATGELG
ncbi:site-specific integrase [Achromobacter sp. DH1f]|uniref:site-specific integrase n=1 Tax=Achromobacter sp. DH1f TaxID=1397275 RepID=UPI0004686377|nr:site-specific integrase [Achromobacter sp. DH1f]